MISDIVSLSTSRTALINLAKQPSRLHKYQRWTGQHICRCSTYAPRCSLAVYEWLANAHAHASCLVLSRPWLRPAALLNKYTCYICKHTVVTIIKLVKTVSHCHLSDHSEGQHALRYDTPPRRVTAGAFIRYECAILDVYDQWADFKFWL